MRVLFVALTSPFPPTNGHRLKTWALLQALAQEGHQITLLILAAPGERVDDVSGLLELCQRVELIGAPRPNGARWGEYAGRAGALFSHLPYGAWRFHCPPLTKRIEEEIASGHFDALLCDGVYNMVNLPASLPVPVLLNKDDIAYLIVQRYLQLERNPAKKLYGWLEAQKLRSWERRACYRATVLVSSEYDREVLQALCPGGRIVVAPNVVDIDRYEPAVEGDSFTVLHQGGMDWHPNRDAVEFFITAVLPELRRLVPGVKFVVAGRNPPGGFRKRFAGVPEVEFTGTVPDMRPIIAKAAVCVVPLRIGSGTRLKILEAGAMGKAIVSTRIGAEGLDFVDGEEILLADEPRAFARAVADLLFDAARRHALGLAARRRVEQQYSTRVLRAAVRQALAESVQELSLVSGKLDLRFSIDEVKA